MEFSVVKRKPRDNWIVTSKCKKKKKPVNLEFYSLLHHRESKIRIFSDKTKGITLVDSHYKTDLFKDF